MGGERGGFIIARPPLSALPRSSEEGLRIIRSDRRAYRFRAWLEWKGGGIGETGREAGRGEDIEKVLFPPSFPVLFSLSLSIQPLPTILPPFLSSLSPFPFRALASSASFSLPYPGERQKKRWKERKALLLVLFLAGGRKEGQLFLEDNQARNPPKAVKKSRIGLYLPKSIVSHFSFIQTGARAIRAYSAQRAKLCFERCKATAHTDQCIPFKKNPNGQSPSLSGARLKSVEKKFPTSSLPFLPSLAFLRPPPLLPLRTARSGLWPFLFGP